jgi:hypothetical protein
LASTDGLLWRDEKVCAKRRVPDPIASELRILHLMTALGLALNEWRGTDRLRPTVLVDIALKPGLDGFEGKFKRSSREERLRWTV